ncbi:hypothetical protein PFISCL1PPCAC_8830, partial [Pristionchus fissidentatus]
KEKKERRQMEAMVKMSLFNGAIDEVVTRLSAKLEPLLKQMIRAEISPKTYVLFWMLEGYDLEVPVAAYEREVEKIRKAIGAVGESAEMGKTKRAREEERLRALEYKLKEEQSRQTDHVERVRAYLRAEKENLFRQTSNANPSLLHTCVLPRAMFSESDAIYAAKFYLLMHTQRTTCFQTLFITDKIMCDILPVVSLLSENEAQSLGRCLQLILSQHAAWHDDTAAYDRDCKDTPGFNMRLKKTAGGEMKGGFAKHDMHAKLLHKWQNRVSKSLQGSLNNTAADYVHLRNCIVVATKMLPCFPLLATDAESMEKAAGGLRDREKGRRDDLSLKAASYVVLLKTRKMQLRNHAYFGCKEPVQPAAAKAAAAAAPAKAASTKAKPLTASAAAGIKSSSTSAAAKSSGAAASTSTTSVAAAKNGVRKSTKVVNNEEKKEKEREIKKEVAVKAEPSEVEGPSLPPPSTSEEKREKEREREKEKEDKGGERAAKRTPTTSSEGDRSKKRRDADLLGGVAARTLLLANKKPKNELDGVVARESKKDDGRNGSRKAEEKESRREESSSSSQRKRDSRRAETAVEGAGAGDEGGEDGEVPPSPPGVRRDEERASKGGSNGATDDRESRREKEKEERRGKAREERKREELKEKIKERENKEPEK